jgi:RNA polymerase sigma factor (sigma-70 family)
VSRNTVPAAASRELTDSDRTGQSVELSLRTRVRAGDQDAFGALFEQNARAVYNHAFRSTGNWSTAEDIVSLTFLEAWRLCGTVHPEGDSLLPWLLGIAINVTRNVSRAARRHQAAMNRLPAPSDVPDFADELAGRLDDTARLEVVRAALGKLRRGERDVIALCVWAGLSYAEAAEALGVPVGTVRSRLSRARRRLQAAAFPGCGLVDWELDSVSEQVPGDRKTAIRPVRGGAR